MLHLPRRLHEDVVERKKKIFSGFFFRDLIAIYENANSAMLVNATPFTDKVPPSTAE